jgi:hypothetical protein
MLPMKIQTGGRTLTIRNPEELHRLAHVADEWAKLPWEDSAPPRQVEESALRNEGRATANGLSLPPLSPGKSYGVLNASVYPNSSETLTVTEQWLKRAWNALGKPSGGATNVQLFDTAQELGYESSAKNPEGAFKTSIRLSPHMERIGMTEKGVVLWVFHETPIREKRKPGRPPKAAEETPDGSDLFNPSVPENLPVGVASEGEYENSDGS